MLCSLASQGTSWSTLTTLLKMLKGRSRSVATTGFVFHSLYVSSRREICLEILKNKEHPNPALFREFYMGVYCFPNPHEPTQALAIKSIGSAENELAAIFIQMADHEKLSTCREAIRKALQMGLKGNFLTFLHF